MANSLSDGLSRRGSAQWGSRRASAFARQTPHDRAAQGSTPRKASLVAHLDGRPASVPIVPSEGGWGSPALGAVTVPSPSLPKASLLPVKDSALGRQPLAVIENAEKGAEYVGDSDKAKGRGSVGSIANSIGEPLDAGL